MDSFNLSTLINGADSQLTSLFSYLALTYFVEFYCICVIKTYSDSQLYNVNYPAIVITVDQNFASNFRQGIDQGCQVFIVHEQTLWLFLDSFVAVHDSADQRFSGKHLIVVLDSHDSGTLQRISEHKTIKDIPDILIIAPESGNVSMELYTTDIFNNGTRGVIIVEIRKIVPPNYFPEKSLDLKGIPIRYRVMQYLPFSYYEETTPEYANARYDPQYSAEDIPVRLDGQEALVLVEFCRRRNCSVEAHPDDWGELFENGTGVGAFGAVANHDAEFTVGAIYFWVGPYKFITYTAQLSRAGVTVVVPKPLALAPWQTPFLSFSGPLWLAVFVAFVVGSFAVWLVESIRHHIMSAANTKPRSISDAVLTIIGFFMEQSAFMRNDFASCIFLYISLLFAGFMVGNLYGAGLASIMTIPQFEKAIETPQDLAESEMLWGADTLTWIFSFSTATEPYLKTLRKNFRVMDLQYLIHHSKTRDFGFVGERTEFGHFGPTDYLDQESSHALRLLKNDILWQGCTAFVSKWSPFRARLDELIMNVRQSGVQYHWELQVVNKYLDVSLQLNVLNGGQLYSESDAETLTVMHFIGAYLILFSGYFAGALAFLLEHIYWKISSRNKKITLEKIRRL